MIHQRTPFEGESKMEVIENIIRKKIDFDKEVSDSCIDCILPRDQLKNKSFQFHDLKKS